jgi:hypothetical protein
MAAFWKKAKPDYATRREIVALALATDKTACDLRADHAIEIEGLRREIAELKSLKLKVDPDGSAPSLAYMQGQIESQSAEIARLSGRYENVSERVDLLSPRVELCEEKLGLVDDDDDPFGDDDDEEDFDDEDDYFLDDDDDDEEDDFDEFDDEFDEDEDGELPLDVIAEIREHQRRLDEEAKEDEEMAEIFTKEHPPVIDVTGEAIIQGISEMGWDATGKDGGQ